MTERSPIFSAKSENQSIGYIEDAEAFDLLGNKRCSYNPSTGNLLELDSGRTIGHVSLAGHFVGMSWIAEELFPLPRAIAAPTISPHETMSDSPQVSPHHEALTTSPKEDADQTITSWDEAVSAVAITLPASSREPTYTAPNPLAAAPDEPVAAAHLPATLSDESSASDAAASLKSLDQPAETDAVTLTTLPAAAPSEAPLSSDAQGAFTLTTSLDELPTATPSKAPLSSDAEGALTLTTSLDEPPTATPSEAPLSSDVEGALEMIRMTLAMNFNNTSHQTMTDVAMQMRNHLTGLRKKRPRTPSPLRYSIELPAARVDDGWKHQQ
jgi:hypothetical protein